MVHTLCSGILNKEKFARFCSDYPRILEPAIYFRTTLRQRTLGEDTWSEYTLTRNMICEVTYTEINTFLVCLFNMKKMFFWASHRIRNKNIFNDLFFININIQFYIIILNIL